MLAAVPALLPGPLRHAFTPPPFGAMLRRKLSGASRRALSTAIRPRRSALYLPGSNARALEKAKSLPCDVLLLDCEDAVAPDNKELARDQIAGALRAGGYGRRELVVRTNSLDTPWGVADLRAAAAAGAGGAAAEGGGRVDGPARVCRARGRADGDLGDGRDAARRASRREPRGLAARWLPRRRHERPRRRPAVRRRVGGARGAAAVAGADGARRRAHGKVALDGVHIDLADDAGLAASCDQGRRLGLTARA